MRAEVLSEVGTVYATQGDGGPPTTLTAGSARGERGVSIFAVQFHGRTSGYRACGRLALTSRFKRAAWTKQKLFRDAGSIFIPDQWRRARSGGVSP
jgi:hypothetical protein